MRDEYDVIANPIVGDVSVPAVRELAEKIVREICGDYSASRKDVVDQAAVLISAAIKPLVTVAQAVSDLDDGDQPFAWKHEEEFSALFDALARWRPTNV